MTWIDVFVPAFVTLFVIVDPVGIAPMFAGLTQGTPAAYRRRMAIKGSLVAAVVLTGFALVGKPLLTALGITIDALRVAGGFMLFLIALEMVFEKRTERREKTADKFQSQPRPDDISVFPIAIPMVAGPGAIATVILLMTNHQDDWAGKGLVLAALGAVLVVTLITFLMAGKVMDILGATVANIITRVLGVILGALAAQYMLDGIRAALIA